MSRLPRPNVPTAVELAVVLRQNGDDAATVKATVARSKKSRRLSADRDANLFVLACTLACPVASLDLDHDPALENREKLVEMPDGRRRRVVIAPKGAVVLRYFPDANDPEHLFYRPREHEHGGSHKVKTLVRGDHGQHSDLALNNKLKRIARNRGGKRVAKRFPTRHLGGRAADSARRPESPKKRWPKRTFPKGRGFQRREP